MVLKSNQEASSKRRLVQVFTLVSALFFLGTLSASTVSLFSGAIRVSQSQEQAAIESSTNTLQQLQQQEAGYESVLNREPTNQTALEGLVNTRLAMNNAQGAIAPLETLVNLYPDRTDYQSVLEEVKQKAENP